MRDQGNNPAIHVSRSFRSFTLRTLLIAITAICVFFGWHTYVIRQRHQARLLLEAKGVSFDWSRWDEKEYKRAFPYDEDEHVAARSWIREMMGDRAAGAVAVPDDGSLNEEDLTLLRHWFPEARRYVGISKADRALMLE